MNHGRDCECASLLVQFAAAIQATKALQNRPRLLEKLVLECLNSGDAAFLNQHRLFAKIPPRLLEKLCRALSYRWRHPRMANVLMNSNTRHLSVLLDKPCWITKKKVKDWTLQDLKNLFDNIIWWGKTSLLSLEIKGGYTTLEGGNPGLPVALLGSLLRELHALTSLHIQCYFEIHETDLLVSILASTKLDIRSLRLPHLSNKSLHTIAHRWPQLESLTADAYGLDLFQLEAVLPRLRNLKWIKTFSRGKFSIVMLEVAQAHDPASPPYKLAEGFDCSFVGCSRGDMIQLFTAFPAIHSMTVSEFDIPTVCAGLEGREHIHITELEMKPKFAHPRALEPLLIRVGQNLIKLHVIDSCSSHRSRVDLNMIGHYCPNLQDLKVRIGHLVADDEFEVTETPHFAKLQRCFLHHDMAENGPAQLPTALVCSVLASPNLEDFESKGVPITEEVVAALVAEREQGALSSLEELTVWYSATLCVEVMAELVSHAPRLRQLDIRAHEKSEGFHQMKSVLTCFLEKSGLKANMRSS